MVTIPLNAFLKLSLFDNSGLVIPFFTAILLGLLVLFFSLRYRFLTTSGAIATFVLAVVIFTFGGWKWTVPILTFFLLSSILSKAGKNHRTPETYSQKSGERDHVQVLVNGGIGGVLVVLYYLFNEELFYIAYVSSLSAVCADTWSTEIGTMKKNRTINILTLKAVPQGISGGVSAAGFAGGVAGSAAIILASIFFTHTDHYLFIVSVMAAGILGNLTDSLLGAIIQEKRKCQVCGNITERLSHCNKQTEHSGGLRFINNDVVNLGTGISGGIFGYFIYQIIQK